MQSRGKSRTILYSLLVLLIVVTGSGTVGRAQHHDDHNGPAGPLKLTSRQNDLVNAVRDATASFKNVTNPSDVGDAYTLLFGCVSGGDFGAMGLHFVKGDVLHDGDVNRNEPEILLFEPLPDGGIRLTGADFIVFKDEWEAKHPVKVPELNGQLFHLFDSPNRFGLDPFYTLHVWAWKDNPNGTFANWNPNVSCDAFNPKSESATSR